jgi:hypothetical protein
MTKKTQLQIPKFPCQITFPSYQSSSHLSESHFQNVSLSCWGCCGQDFASKKDVEKDILQNTFDFEEEFGKGKTLSQLEQFRDRFDKHHVSPSGLCFNLVRFSNGCLACPLHNRINELVDKKEFKGPKKDLRENHCDVNYECDTFKQWKHWTDEKKVQFLKFIEEKKMSHYQYSVLNGEDKMVEYFEKAIK